jgi:hypothetical protein
MKLRITQSVGLLERKIGPSQVIQGAHPRLKQELSPVIDWPRPVQSHCSFNSLRPLRCIDMLVLKFVHFMSHVNVACPLCSNSATRVEYLTIANDILNINNNNNNNNNNNPAIASSDFVTRIFSRVGLSTPRPTPGYPGGPMFSVRVVSLSCPVPILKRQDLAFCPCMTAYKRCPGAMTWTCMQRTW